MPSYLYGCPECGNNLEVIHRMLENPVVLCKNCSCTMVRKPQVGAVQFVGGGFYSKDKGEKK